MFNKLKLNYAINIKNPRDLKTKYYKYINENINLKEKNKLMRVLIKKEFKDIFNECRKEFGYVPQTAYLKQRFAKINEMLKKIS
jgi:predicted metal-dependent peptidase